MVEFKPTGKRKKYFYQKVAFLIIELTFCDFSNTEKLEKEWKIFRLVI